MSHVLQEKNRPPLVVFGKGTIQQSSLSLQATPPHLQCKTDPAEIVFTRRKGILFRVVFRHQELSDEANLQLIGKVGLKHIGNILVRTIAIVTSCPQIGEEKKGKHLKPNHLQAVIFVASCFIKSLFFQNKWMAFRILFLPKQSYHHLFNKSPPWEHPANTA